MLAKRIAELPVGENSIYEPKWDGFRAIVFRDGDEVLIQSRDEKPLNRYFPELLEPLRRGLPTRYVADGEIVIAKGGALDFDELQLRCIRRHRESSCWRRRVRRQWYFSICFVRERAICGMSPFDFDERRCRRR
jgi:ATP-dependent DNA ligase